MKTTKKVIEKISLQLMFVTFVVATMMFAVGPVSAAPKQCDESFCDQDCDGLFKDHKRCAFVSCEVPIDNDDTAPNLCDSDPIDGAIYTAKLTKGVFIFDSPDVPKVIPYDSGNLDLVSADDDQNAQMFRPSDTDGIATWDHLFSTGCPELVQTPPLDDPWIVDSFVSSAYNWSWEKPGGRRLVLRNIHVEDFYGVEWEIRVQLIGKANDPDVPEFLPTTGSIKTTLIKGRLEGRTLSHAPGQRRSCAEKGDIIDTSCEDLGPSGKMEGFCLLNWEIYGSEMEIAILPPPPPD